MARSDDLRPRHVRADLVAQAWSSSPKCDATTRAASIAGCPSSQSEGLTAAELAGDYTLCQCDVTAERQGGARSFDHEIARMPCGLSARSSAEPSIKMQACRSATRR